MSSATLQSATLPRGYMAVKVIIDFSLAFILLVVTAPLTLLSVLLVKLTSRGPAFYSQTRLGLEGKPFRIYKIRTMAHDCEKSSGPVWCKQGDARVTRVGRVLRRCHFDELPQLWNVLRGDMSLVGPRPERPEFVPGLEKALPRYRERLQARPGVTGLAQVQLPPDTDLESVRRKLAHDFCYVENAGFWLDLRILIGTFFHVFGLSGTITRWLLRLPGGEAVENAYATPLLAPTLEPFVSMRVQPQLQPA